MSLCKTPNCSNKIETTKTIDGKKRNMGNRIYCLECKPIDSKGTKRILSEEEVGIKKFKQALKSRNYYANNKKTINDNIKAKTKDLKQILIDLTKGCQLCGYNKCSKSICFHHVNEEEKLFGLSAREFRYGIKHIINEISKCIIICNNCHGPELIHVV